MDTIEPDIVDTKDLDIIEVKGVGKHFQSFLHSKGIRTIGDLVNLFVKSSKKGGTPESQQEKLMKLVYSPLYLNCKRISKGIDIGDYKLPTRYPFHFSIVNKSAYAGMYDVLKDANDPNIVLPSMDSDVINEHSEILLKTYMGDGVYTNYNPSIKIPERVKKPKHTSKISNKVSSTNNDGGKRSNKSKINTSDGDKRSNKSNSDTSNVNSKTPIKSKTLRRPRRLNRKNPKRPQILFGGGTTRYKFTIKKLDRRWDCNS